MDRDYRYLRERTGRCETRAALTGRADELGAAAVQHPPRLDTVAGSRAMSRRLINVHQLDQAADTIDAALATAGRLPHPDPAVATLAALAAGLREHTAVLRAAAEEDWWTGYFNCAHRAAQAARERERAESDRLHVAAAVSREPVGAPAVRTAYEKLAQPDCGAGR